MTYLEPRKKTDLMRVVTNEALIKRNRQIAQISFFASMAVLVVFFVLSYTNQDEQLSFYLNCVATPLLFLSILFAVRMSNRWIREPVPWQALPEGLKGVSTSSVLYNYILPADHLLVTPRGVFALHPIVYDRAVVVKSNRWMIRGGMLGTIMAFLRQENIGNPTKDAQEQAEAVQDVLDDVLDEHEIEVQPVIVFTHPEADVDIQGDVDIPVTFALNTKLKPTLKEYVKGIPEGQRATLTPEQIDILDSHFIYENPGAE